MASGSSPPLRRILLCALAALTVGLGAVSLIEGFSTSFPVRLLEGLAVFGAGAVILGGVALLAVVNLAGWRDPESEADFEALVQRSERLAAQDSWGDSEDYETGAPDDDDDEAFDPRQEEDFKALVRTAVDDLPLEFHRALEHVAIVVADGGRHAPAQGSHAPAQGSGSRAYGLYQGGTVARDFFHDRIVIFRDSLLRDFGADPELLKAQVTRTVRHELAHHLGSDEQEVRRLGL